MGKSHSRARKPLLFYILSKMNYMSNFIFIKICTLYDVHFLLKINVLFIGRTIFMANHAYLLGAQCEWPAMAIYWVHNFYGQPCLFIGRTMCAPTIFKN